MLLGIPEFVAVIDTGSFTQAANVLNCSKSHLSQKISRLEQQLGVQLMHRTTRSLHITDIGEQFYQQSKHSLDLLNQAVAQVQEAQNTLCGRIRINSVGGYFGEQILAPAILTFMDVHPDVAIDLDFTSSHVDLIGERYDIAVRMGNLPDSSLVAREIRLKPHYLVAHPNYLSQHSDLCHPNDLRNHKLICGSLLHWVFQNQNQQVEVPLEGALCCPNGYVQVAAVKAGLGICRLPDYYAEPLINSGELVAILPQWNQHLTPISVVYPKVRFKVRRIQALVEYLVNWFAQHSK